MSVVPIDRQLGFACGWRDWSTFQYKTPDEGVATHVKAAFEPSLKGKIDGFALW